VGADHAGIDARLDIRSVRAEHHRCHLAMQDGGGDVRIVGRDLTIALKAVIGGHADDADEVRGERLHAGNLWHFLP